MANPVSSSTITKIIFGDGKAFQIIGAYNDSELQKVQGQDRVVVDVQLPIDQYDAICAEVYNADNTVNTANLVAVKLTQDITTTFDDNTTSQQHMEYPKTNMLIVAHCDRKLVQTADATDTAPAATELRTALTLAQLTYQEVQQAAQQAQIDALTLAQLGVK